MAKKSKIPGGKGMAARGYKSKIIYLRPGEMERVKKAAKIKGKDAAPYIVEVVLADADATIEQAERSGRV